VEKGDFLKISTESCGNLFDKKVERESVKKFKDTEVNFLIF